MQRSLAPEKSEEAHAPSGVRDDARWRELMRRARAGDAGAYRTLLDELYSAVYAYVRQMIGDSSLVEDCVQDCLESVHRHRGTYDPRRPFRPWLFTIVRHRAIDLLRRDALRRERTRAAGVHASAVGDAAAECPAADALDVDRLLDQLDPIYRDAVVWTKLEGWSIAEAAERAGVTRIAMRSRVHRGLRRLERLLAVAR